VVLHLRRINTLLEIKLIEMKRGISNIRVTSPLYLVIFKLIWNLLGLIVEPSYPKVTGSDRHGYKILIKSFKRWKKSSLHLLSYFTALKARFSMGSAHTDFL
jgi:hypothetical protein